LHIFVVGSAKEACAPVAKYAVAYAHNITLCYVTLTFTYLVTFGLEANRMFLIQKVNYEFCREL